MVDQVARRGLRALTRDDDLRLQALANGVGTFFGGLALAVTLGLTALSARIVATSVLLWILVVLATVGAIWYLVMLIHVQWTPFYARVRRGIEIDEEDLSERGFGVILSVSLYGILTLIAVDSLLLLIRLTLYA